MSAEDALKRYFQRELLDIKKLQTRRRRNGRPEWELTKKPCMAWFKANGWAMTAVESRAVYNHAAGKFTAGMAAPGTSDAMGCTPDGLGAYVEFKAPKRRNTLKLHQYEFLKDKIMKGAFAVCVDSVESLNGIWAEFKLKRAIEPMLARNLLLKHLPQPRVASDNLSDILNEGVSDGEE